MTVLLFECFCAACGIGACVHVWFVERDICVTGVTCAGASVLIRCPEIRVYVQSWSAAFSPQQHWSWIAYASPLELQCQAQGLAGHFSHPLTCLYISSKSGESYRISRELQEIVQALTSLLMLCLLWRLTLNSKSFHNIVKASVNRFPIKRLCHFWLHFSQ